MSYRLVPLDRERAGWKTTVGWRLQNYNCSGRRTRSSIGHGFHEKAMKEKRNTCRVRAFRLKKTPVLLGNYKFGIVARKMVRYPKTGDFVFCSCFSVILSIYLFFSLSLWCFHLHYLKVAELFRQSLLSLEGSPSLTSCYSISVLKYSLGRVKF